VKRTEVLRDLPDTALAVATVHIIKGILKSNQRAANVEHQLDVEHVTA